MSAIVKPRYTLEEYFELERTSEEKYEYFNGEVFCMSGTTRNHSLIAGNILATLKGALRAQGCEVHGPDLRVRTPGLPPYRYPDVSVVCGIAEFEQIGGLDVLTNPVLIIEVLSPSTEAFDRGDKFTYYKSISNFLEYLLVAQHRPHVTHYFKQDDGKWNYEEFNDLGDTVDLASVDCALSLRELYRDAAFPQEVQPPIVQPHEN